MFTVYLNRTPAQFWNMTMREINIVFKEWTKIETEKNKSSAMLNGYSSAMFAIGKMPFEDSVKGRTELIIDNDNAILS